MIDLNIPVTAIESVSKRNTAKIKTLASFLSDGINRYKPVIDLIRTCTDKTTIDQLKATLPACQFCITDGRGSEGIQQASNLMQIDIDAKDNTQIKDLKGAISEIPFIHFAMYSASGKGVFALVKIIDSKQFKAHFEAFRTYIENTYQIFIDKAVSNPASLRFWSYDPAPIINPTSEVWRYVPKPREIKPFNLSVSERGVNDPFSDFNIRGEIESLLQAHGWKYQHTKGTRKRYSRPGKTSGVSADYCTERKILYVFSSDSSTQIHTANKGYNHVSVFCQLECANDIKLCAKKLKELGYGASN